MNINHVGPDKLRSLECTFAKLSVVNMITILSTRARSYNFVIIKTPHTSRVPGRCLWIVSIDFSCVCARVRVSKLFVSAYCFTPTHILPSCCWPLPRSWPFSSLSGIRSFTRWCLTSARVYRTRDKVDVRPCYKETSAGQGIVYYFPYTTHNRHTVSDPN